MNAADLARLELAKRAFRAMEPSAAEVQRGVRRARLALQRPKARRRWFSKGAVMLVLAVGGLAYAKPQAVGELVSNLGESSKVSGKRGTGQGVGPVLLDAPEERASSAPSVSLQADAQAPSPNAAITDRAAHHRVPSPAQSGEARSFKPEPLGHSAARAATLAAAAEGPAASANQAAQSNEAPAVGPVISDWGRVGQALAQGDETQALAALSELSESDDRRTRDKADLGRAQLFMANGDRERACALARELTHRRAGSRIERQAQAIIKTCTR